MKKWEYLQIKSPSTDELCKLGKDGWEMIDTFVRIHEESFIGSTSDVYYVFKRELIQRGRIGVKNYPSKKDDFFSETK
jgi:hypothetical protein